jgi:hypothetical protein
MKSFQMFLKEMVKLHNLPEPGETPIPKDHVRLYHQTSAENLDKIREHGIQLGHARGIEGPKGVWASEQGFYGNPSERPTAEFHIPKHEWDGSGVIRRSIQPHEIIAAHYPWHRHARYMVSHPEVLAAVKNGEHDNLREYPDHRAAIDYVKQHH